jgi:hypothetical protein
MEGYESCRATGSDLASMDAPRQDEMRPPAPSASALSSATTFQEARACRCPSTTKLRNASRAARCSKSDGGPVPTCPGMALSIHFANSRNYRNSFIRQSLACVLLRGVVAWITMRESSAPMALLSDPCKSSAKLRVPRAKVRLLSLHPPPAIFLRLAHVCL